MGFLMGLSGDRAYSGGGGGGIYESKKTSGTNDFIRQNEIHYLKI